MGAIARKTGLIVVSPATMQIPSAIAGEGRQASERFFIDAIRNKNTWGGYQGNCAMIGNLG